MLVENPILFPTEAEEKTYLPVAKCFHKHCDEVLYKGEGYVFDGDQYCSSSCIGEQLIVDGAAIEACEVA